MDLEKIGFYIAKCRKEMGMTQEELAQRIGITSKAVSKWECGRGLPDISIMLELCYVLGINIISLLMGEDSDTKYIIRREGGSLCKRKKRKLFFNKYPNVANLSTEKIVKIKDLENPDIAMTIEGKVEGFQIEEKDWIIRCKLEVSDDSGKIEVNFKDNQKLKLKTLIGQIKIGDIYRMKGFLRYDELTHQNYFLVMLIEKI